MWNAWAVAGVVEVGEVLRLGLQGPVAAVEVGGNAIPHCSVHLI